MTNSNEEYNKYQGTEGDYEDYNEPEDDEEYGEYAAGYGNPPKHSQFKKGHSGNLKGRPKEKAAETPAEALARVFSETIETKEKGKTKSIKVMEAIAKKAVGMALQGNVSLLKIFLSNAIIDPYLFKDAINKYNCPPENVPKTLPPELRLIVNKAKEMMRKTHAEEMEKRERGEIE